MRRFLPFRPTFRNIDVREEDPSLDRDSDRDRELELVDLDEDRGFRGIFLLLGDKWLDCDALWMLLMLLMLILLLWLLRRPDVVGSWSCKCAWVLRVVDGGEAGSMSSTEYDSDESMLMKERVILMKRVKCCRPKSVAKYGCPLLSSNVECYACEICTSYTSPVSR